MFILLSEVVPAPVFRGLQNHGSLNWSFCEVTKGTDDSFPRDNLHPGLPRFLSTFGKFNKIWSVFAGDPFCFWKCIFFVKVKIIDAGLHHYDQNKMRNCKIRDLQVPVMWGTSYAASLSLKWLRSEWVMCCHLHSLLICSNVTDFLLEHVQMYSHNKWLESSVAVDAIFTEGLWPGRPVLFCWPSIRIRAPLSNWQDFQCFSNWI